MQKAFFFVAHILILFVYLFVYAQFNERFAKYFSYSLVHEKKSTYMMVVDGKNIVVGRKKGKELEVI